MYFFLILLLASQLSFAADLSFDEIAKKITSPNVNVLNAFKETFKAIDELKQNKDSSKELVLFKAFTDSSICLKNFSNEVRDKKYSELLEGMQKKIVSSQDVLGKIATNEKYKKVLMEYVGEIQGEVKESYCHFEIKKDESYLNNVKEKLEYKKEFNAIMELKKIVHPNFVKMIEELEGNKQGLTMGISSDVPLEPGNYEKNFVTMYKIQFPFNDGLAAGEIEKIKKDCTIKPEEIYLKECK